MSQSLDRMIRLYDGHPLSRRSIVERIERGTPWPVGPDEFDLAFDRETEITDQNHVGGALSTMRLASRASLRASDRVLDLGCGLGGPARLIAHVHGCTVHGIDANPDRIADASALTAWVGLSDRVTFSCADINVMPASPGHTLVWGQNAWIHLGAPTVPVGIACAALPTGGRIAFEDVCLIRDVVPDASRRALGRLGAVWSCTLSSLDRWRRAFEDAGCTIAMSESDDGMLVDHFTKADALATRHPGRWPEHEVVGWRTALSLARDGVIGYARVVAEVRRP